MKTLNRFQKLEEHKNIEKVTIHRQVQKMQEYENVYIYI